MNEGAKHDDFCILYRTNAQSRSFEDALRKRIFLIRFMEALVFTSVKKSKMFCRILDWLLTLRMKKLLEGL